MRDGRAPHPQGGVLLVEVCDDLSVLAIWIILLIIFVCLSWGSKWAGNRTPLRYIRG
jgi:hypothetical protein